MRTPPYSNPLHSHTTSTHAHAHTFRRTPWPSVVSVGGDSCRARSRPISGVSRPCGTRARAPHAFTFTSNIPQHPHRKKRRSNKQRAMRNGQSVRTGVRVSAWGCFDGVSGVHGGGRVLSKHYSQLSERAQRTSRSRAQRWTITPPARDAEEERRRRSETIKI